MIIEPRLKRRIDEAVSEIADDRAVRAELLVVELLNRVDALNLEITRLQAAVTAYLARPHKK